MIDLPACILYSCTMYIIIFIFYSPLYPSPWPSPFAITPLTLTWVQQMINLIGLSIYLNIHLSQYPSVSIAIYLNIHLYKYPSISIFIYLNIHLSQYPSISISIYINIHLFQYPFISISIYLSISVLYTLDIIVYKNVSISTTTIPYEIINLIDGICYHHYYTI